MFVGAAVNADDPGNSLEFLSKHLFAQSFRLTFRLILSGRSLRGAAFRPIFDGVAGRLCLLECLSSVSHVTI